MDKEKFNKALGKHIKKLREEKGYSQQDLASLMGINFQNISSYERGIVAPTVFWIHRLCDALDTELLEFFMEFDEHSIYLKKTPK